MASAAVPAGRCTLMVRQSVGETSEFLRSTTITKLTFGSLSHRLKDRKRQHLVDNRRWQAAEDISCHRLPRTARSVLCRILHASVSLRGLRDCKPVGVAGREGKGDAEETVDPATCLALEGAIRQSPGSVSDPDPPTSAEDIGVHLHICLTLGQMGRDRQSRADEGEENAGGTEEKNLHDVCSSTTVL